MNSLLIKWGIIAFFAVGVVLTSYTKGYANGKDKVQRLYDEYKAKQTQLMLDESEKARNKEKELQDQIIASEKLREKENALNKKIADGLRAESRRLRNDIAAYASGRSEDSAAAIRERAVALGNVLEEALRVSSLLAEDAESLNADLRAVLDAWPKIKKGAEAP